jgi:hypothetical protein
MAADVRDAELAELSEATLLRKLLAACSHMSALGSQATELTPIVEVLARSIGCEAVVVDRGLEALAAAAPGEGPGELRRKELREPIFRTVLTAAARGRRPLAVPDPGQRGTTVVAPVLVGADVAGYVLAGSPRPDAAAPFTEDMRLLAVEHAAMVCGLVMGRDLVVAAAAGRARHELVEALLLSRDREDPELGRWARHLGLDFDRDHVVVVFEGAADDAARVERLLTGEVPGTVVASRPDEVVAIIPADAEGTALERARTLAGSAARGAAGVGNPCASPAGIARSYAQARRAIEAGRRLGKPGGVSVFADLGIHRLLLQVPEAADLRAFAEEVLGGIAAEGRSAGNDYLATLAAYFRENGSPAKAGQQLHVHPNTVGYRIRRVEELTGLSFSVQRDRLMAEVAVEILQALGGVS